MRSSDMSPVAQQRVWEEHLHKVSNLQRRQGVNTVFAVNPFRMQSKTMTEPKINKRPAKFLDREQAALEAISKQLGHRAHELNFGTDSVLPALNKSSPRNTLGERTPQEKATSLPPIQKSFTLENDEVTSKSLQKLKEIHQTPAEKYKFPQTEAQELGWLSKPLIAHACQPQHGKRSCNETRFAVHAVKAGTKLM